AGDDLPVGRAADGDGDRQGPVVSGQADDAHIVAEVFAAELRTEAEVLGELEDRLLELLVTEAVPGDCVAGRRKVVEVVGAGEFRGLERELGRRAADDDGQMVGRAGRSTQGGDLL